MLLMLFSIIMGYNKKVSLLEIMQVIWYRANKSHCSVANGYIDIEKFQYLCYVVYRSFSE